MKKFYQDSDSFVHVVVSDRNKLAEIFCEYGIFVFHSSVYGETAAYNERIALPELTGSDAKTVAMVQDKQYSEAISKRTKPRTKPKKEAQELNDFMRSQAQKAIERIEGMKKSG